MKIKIGIILDFPAYGGGSFQYAWSMLEALYISTRKRNHELIIFVRFDEWEDYLSNFEIKKIRIVGQYIKDKLIIDAEECDLIFASCQSNWSERLCSPTVVPIHDLMHRYETGFPEVGDERERRARDYLFHSITEKAFGILVDSQIGLEHVTECYGKYHEKKIHVLPFAIPRYLNEIEQDIEIPFNKYIFYPAQFWKHKNHVNLLKSISELRKQKIIVNCVFVGSKMNGYDDAVALVDELNLNNQIIFLGYVSNSQMGYLYKNACALVMPTFFGPTNIPPIEAMSLGCPVAVSGIFGMPDQLGDAAIYFNPSNVDEIASAIKKYWMDDDFCQIMRIKGKRQAEKYTQNEFNIKFDRIFEDLLDKACIYKEKTSRLRKFCNDHNRIFLYGAGINALFLLSIMRKLGINAEAIFVTELKDNIDMESIFDKDIYEFNMDKVNDMDGIICAGSKLMQEEVEHYLIKQGVLPENMYLTDAIKVKEIYEIMYR
ncbi:MAG: glycosyltransferase family 4 protein [Lachnospiraceae bacterium]|nr:glycosyltransferase family 4 protein [Lachnospiraceae bacterium]